MKANAAAGAVCVGGGGACAAAALAVIFLVRQELLELYRRRGRAVTLTPRPALAHGGMEERMSIGAAKIIRRLKIAQ